MDQINLQTFFGKRAFKRDQIGNVQEEIGQIKEYRIKNLL